MKSTAARNDDFWLFYEINTSTLIHSLATALARSAFSDSINEMSWFWMAADDKQRVYK